MIEKCTCNRREKIDFSIKQRMNDCSLVQRHQDTPTPENPISHSCPQLSSSSSPSQIYSNILGNNNNNNINTNNNWNCNCNNRPDHQDQHQHQYQQQNQHQHQNYLHHYHHHHHQENIGRQCMCASGSDSLRHFNKNCSIQPPHHWPSSTV
ncbi:LIM domain-containing protein A-like [Eupeodes corollae]|uniref:LIM domain-containing protein A-like n=1 Tax=Eupeodes corollae TaxID=290404 RepID=UPI0024903A6D|nr:LIM domain-containing protein A-like [Eupeodes corollae]